uniref:Uncharacterized protein n=1 Tax=Solanum lycopersicum TaxID=4081 RepID=A0A3Q7ID40_SOLLC
MAKRELKFSKKILIERTKYRISLGLFPSSKKLLVFNLIINIISIMLKYYNLTLFLI